MDIRTLLDELADPAAYPHSVDQVIVFQTHISVVFLAGPFAYKVKKPVALGFLDFSTPDRRHHACDDEVRLNRRLAPHVYLGVVPITCDQGRLQVDGPGEPVDWAVKMVRLPDGASLLDRITRGEIGTADMERLARFLASFHCRAEGGPRVAEFGRFEVVAGNALENFTQSETHVGTTISRSVFDRLRTLTDLTLGRLGPFIANRAARGVPRDTHGDLHLDHIYFDSSRPPPDDLFAIDCIEFNERFRYADPVADLAFLIMDLKFHSRPDLADILGAAYFAAAGDPEGATLLPFYTAYRANVRGKVEGLELAEAEIPAEEKVAATARARGHWLLALGELEEPVRRPGLVLVGGLSGTGKSSLSRTVAEACGFEVVRSDVVRKELAGRDPESPGTPDLYTSERTEQTYAESLRRADRLLFDGRRVIVDATFRADAHRRAFLALAHDLQVPAVMFVCEAPPEVVRARLTARTGDASDATWDTYVRQHSQWEPLSAAVASIVVSVATDQGPSPLATATTALQKCRLL